MDHSGKSKVLADGPSRTTKVMRLLLLSPLFGGIVCGLLGIVFVLVSYAQNPANVTVGSGPAPGGVSILAFIACGFVGLVAGLVVGIIGAIVIVLRR